MITIGEAWELWCQTLPQTVTIEGNPQGRSGQVPLHNAAWEGPWDLKWTMELSIKLIASAQGIVGFWSVTVVIIFVAFF